MASRTSACWRLGLGGFLVGSMLLAAVLGFFWTPYPPDRMAPAQRLQPPSGTHFLGTDHYGRDILSRVMTGAITSVLVGLIAVGIGMGGGVLLGMVAAYCGGWIDELLMRTCDVLFAFPAVLTAVLLAAVLGPSLTGAMVAIGLFFIPVFGRLSRAGALSVWQREYVLAARAAGMGEGYIAFRHVLPNIAGPLVVQASVQFALAILAEAALSYLGLGIQPPHASWGRMLSESQTFLGLAPWTAIFPGMAIAWSVLGFNLLGDLLRDAIDPKSAP